MKLYYDDPLKAAWMAREFGVAFIQLDEHPVLHEISVLGIMDWTELQNTGGKHGLTFDTYRYDYYIHPDSYSIFEPQEGDLNVQGLFFELGVWRAYFGETVVESYVDKTRIQRNNTAFFMPKDSDE